MTALRALVSVSTVGLLYFIYRHYQLDLQFLKAKETIDPSGKRSTSNIRFCRVDPHKWPPTHADF